VNCWRSFSRIFGAPQPDTRVSTARSRPRFGAGIRFAWRWGRRLTAEEFDRLADLPVDDPAGDMPYVDWSKARRPGREVQRVNVDFPVDLLRSIDREARRIGVTRQAFIKLRISDTLTNT
jgi:hypothetical protein